MATRKQRNCFREDKPRQAIMRDRGYWGIGIFHPKKEYNFGTALRNAYAFGASFVYTIGPRFSLQASDTARAWRHMPVYQYRNIEDLRAHLPYACALVGVELVEEAVSLVRFPHPEQACYLLGAEDYGLPPEAVPHCDHVVRIPGAAYCLNLASAATIVMYDRVAKRSTRAGGMSIPEQTA
jgi:tRNA G18 (ribose-2'-O)-methylase SpoU